MRLISVRADGRRRVWASQAGDRWLPAADLARGRPRDDGRPARAAAAAALAALARRAATRPGSPTTAGPSPRPTSSRRCRAPARSSRSGATTASTPTRKASTPPPAPLIFAKWPSSVVGPGADIRWDPGADRAGRLRGRARRRHRPHGAPRVAVADALDHVLGYTCLNDVSARDLQFGDGQWTRGKSLDTFCPMGPALVTADELARPAGARDRVPGQRRGPPGRQHGADVLRRRGDHQPLLDGVHARARRRDRDRDAGRRRDLPRPAASCSRTATWSTVEIEGIGALTQHVPARVGVPRRARRAAAVS